MQIKNVTFNKGDFKYSIEYFDGRAVRKVSTNEEALQSFDLAVLTLAKNIKNFLKLNDGQAVKVTKIKFGKNEDSASTVNINAFGDGVDMGIVTKIIPVNKEEHFPDQLLVSCNIALDEVRGEINRYLKGERAQMELDFDAEIGGENEERDE